MQFSVSLFPIRTNKKPTEMKEFHQHRVFVRDGSIERPKLILPDLSSAETIHIWISDSSEILEFNSFTSCQKLLWISFESYSHMTRIEWNTFSGTSLEWIVIPRNVQFIDDSAFIGGNLPSISIESGNDIFAIEKDFPIDVVHHKLIQNFSKWSEIEIGRNSEMVSSSCFSCCISL
jgi:hypothetical protein